MAFFASAQSASRTVVYGPSTEITAERLTHDPSTNTTQARGNVRIAYQHSVITADEADLHHLKDRPAAVDVSIELRGNVKLVLTPSTAR